MQLAHLDLQMHPLDTHSKKSNKRYNLSCAQFYHIFLLSTHYWFEIEAGMPLISVPEVLYNENLSLFLLVVIQVN